MSFGASIKIFLQNCLNMSYLYCHTKVIFKSLDGTITIPTLDHSLYNAVPIHICVNACLSEEKTEWHLWPLSLNLQYQHPH